MEHLSLDTFKEKIFDFEQSKEWNFKGAKPVIIDFYADWCGPCKMVTPVLQELADEYKDKIEIFKVDTEKEQELAFMFNIKSIPSILFIPLDDKPRMSVGAMPKEGFTKAIEDIFKITLS